MYVLWELYQPGADAVSPNLEWLKEYAQEKFEAYSCKWEQDGDSWVLETDNARYYIEEITLLTE